MDLFDKFSPIIDAHANLPADAEDPFNVSMDKILSPTEAIIKGRHTILAGTNNYLGLTFDERPLKAAHAALDAGGTGTTGSRVLNGTYAGHKALEQDLADFYGQQHAIVFSTGYQANLGVISTLAGPKNFILIDSDCHASIYDGCRLGGATIIRFRHNDAADLDKRLRRLGEQGSNILIVVEGIYSMLGDIAPLREIAAVKRKYGAYLMVDEAHSLGVMGKTGRGVAQEQGVEADVDFIVGTFSKSVGTVGGFCVSSHPKFEVLRLVMRPYMFTASLPPSVVASARASLAIITASNLREKLWANARALHQGMERLGFSLGASCSPVVAIKIAAIDDAVRFWSELLRAGVYVNLAVPPATPGRDSLLRCSLCAAHSPEQIEKILGVFQSVGRRLDLISETPRDDADAKTAVSRSTPDAAAATG